MVAKALKVILTRGLDLIHVHYAVPFAFIAHQIKNTASCSDIALIATLHGTDVAVYGRDPSIGPSLGDTLKSFDLLTTVSNSHAHLSVDVFHLETEPQVIPNFVDLNRFVMKNPKILSKNEFPLVRRQC